MPASPVSRQIAAAVSANLKHLAIRAFGLTIQTMPCPVLIVRAGGFLMGLLLLCVNFRRWKAVAAFARDTHSLPAWRYVLRFFMQAGRDRVWAHAYYEGDSRLDRFVTVEDLPALRGAVEKGRGVLLLGAHYGPFITRLALYKHGTDVRQLIAADSIGQAEALSAVVLKPLRSRQLSFFLESERPLTAGKSEKEMARCLRAGGVVHMMLDFPGVGPGSVPARILGLPVKFNGFPFRLALRYDIPLLFCFFEQAPRAGYRLRFVPLPPFSTPDEGAQAYALLLQQRLQEDPFLWRFLPYFVGWFPPGRA